MTLKDVIRTIEGVASRQPAINMIVQGDIFRLNANPKAKYGVFAWVQQQHDTSADSSIINYSFTFFYVDRLKANKSNQVEIQSVGIETLDNIVRTLDELGLFAESTYSFQVFNQRFMDECAGVFCNVALSVPVSSVCPEEFGNGSRGIRENVIIY